MKEILIKIMNSNLLGYGLLRENIAHEKWPEAIKQIDADILKHKNQITALENMKAIISEVTVQ